MFTSLDISTSALIAQRTRMDAISGNIANLSTTRNETGEAVPYQPRFVVFKTDEQTKTPEGAMGVRVDSVETAQKEPLWRYQPGHPDAQLDGPHKGYVAYPNVDMTTEFVDSLNATRAYEANIGVIEASKSMFGQALKIIG
jgi:flagellar basal-body rod protein FlgC